MLIAEVLNMRLLFCGKGQLFNLLVLRIGSHFSPLCHRRGIMVTALRNIMRVRWGKGQCKLKQAEDVFLSLLCY